MSNRKGVLTVGVGMVLSGTCFTFYELDEDCV